MLFGVFAFLAHLDVAVNQQARGLVDRPIVGCSSFNVLESGTDNWVRMLGLLYFGVAGGTDTPEIDSTLGGIGQASVFGDDQRYPSPVGNGYGTAVLQDFGINSQDS